MLAKNSNPAAEILRKNGKVSASWVQGGSPIMTEILAEAGFDVLLIDMEHGAASDTMTLISMIQAMKGEPAVPFVRAHWNDMVQIKRILDSGAYGLVIPYVSTKAEAEAAIRAAKYPPEGVRGIASSSRAAHFNNNSKEYFDTANKDIFVFLQIETPEGVKNIDEILSIPALDGIFIGPMDLATTHGFRGLPKTPEVVEIILGLEKKIKAKGKAMATISFDFEDTKAKYARGYNLVVSMADTVTLGKIARDEVERFRKEIL